MTGLAAMLGIAAVFTFIYYMYVAYWMITFLIALICAKLFRKVEGMSSVFFGVLVFFIVFSALNIPPLIEPLATYRHYKMLCEKDSGIKIYKTVELNANMWDEHGSPIFYNKKTNSYDFEKIPELRDRFSTFSVLENPLLFGVKSKIISYRNSGVVDSSGGLVVGKKIYYYNGAYSSIGSIYDHLYKYQNCPSPIENIISVSDKVFTKKEYVK